MKIVVLKNDSIGDTIHSLPCINEILVKHNSDDIYFFLSKINKYTFFFFKKSNTHLKVFNYSNIKKLGTYDKIDIYVSTNWQCADFKKICINKPKKNYFLENKNSYLFIKTTDRETF